MGQYYWGSSNGAYDYTMHPMNKYWQRMCDVNSNPCCPQWGVIFSPGGCLKICKRIKICSFGAAAQIIPFSCQMPPWMGSQQPPGYNWPTDFRVSFSQTSAWWMVLPMASGGQPLATIRPHLHSSSASTPARYVAASLADMRREIPG